MTRPPQDAAPLPDERCANCGMPFRLHHDRKDGRGATWCSGSVETCYELGGLGRFRAAGRAAVRGEFPTREQSLEAEVLLLRERLSSFEADFLKVRRSLTGSIHSTDDLRDVADSLVLEVERLRAASPVVAPSAEPLNAMAREVNEINRANGWAVVTPEQWADTYKIPGILALIHSEVSEALEGFRHDDRANFAEELADVLIRVLDCAGGLGINLDAEVAAKLAKNRTRGHKHGGKRV